MKFFRISAAFVIGLAIVVLGCDRLMGVFLEKTGHRGGIAPDVQRAIDNVERKPKTVRVIVLGDSVSKQFFGHGTEPADDVRYLTTNQAVTMAGQCYLAENAMRECPGITDVYLFLLPMALENDMPRPYTHDFFCGHFHSAHQVGEVFMAKRDLELSFAHAGRWMVPNLMTANSLSQPAAAMEVGSGLPQSTAGLAKPDPERLLTSLSQLIGPPPEPVLPAPPGKHAAHFSPTSRYFFDKLRHDCRQRGIWLHMFASPMSAEAIGYGYVDPAGIYDAPIIDDVPAAQLIDAIHFKRPFDAMWHARVVEAYHLDFVPRRKTATQ